LVRGLRVEEGEWRLERDGSGREAEVVREFLRVRSVDG
jgi:hypothetical protein